MIGMHIANTRTGDRPRRGNTIVLVIGILAMLVIIATGFLTRTHAGRVTATSQQRASLRDDNAQGIADFLADEIALALFPRPIDPSGPNVSMFPPRTARSDVPRLLPVDNPVRYGVDRDADGDGFADFPYNFVPYHVVPYTNWPDPDPTDPLDIQSWPPGPGNPTGGGISPNLAVVGNRLGNPGTGDTRWLADTEPLRERTNWGEDLALFTDDDVFVFTHWRHMTNVARADNGWRICSDISNVTGNLVTGPDLGIPFEQFLPARTDSFDVATLKPRWQIDSLFRWQNFFTNYRGTYYNRATMPPNLIELKDLNGNGITHEPDELPGSAARREIERVLADADGDGFTDSFWFAAPTSTERGIRQVVAVRIIDNQAMLNASVATRFVHNDFVGPGFKTRGATPADLALVGNADPKETFGSLPSVHNNVGFYDNPDHWSARWSMRPSRFDSVPWYTGDFIFYYDDIGGSLGTLSFDAIDLWARHVRETGLVVDPAFLYPAQIDRADYWHRAGLSPLFPDPDSALPGPAPIYTPFGIPEEIELRMYHGNNYPWIFTRLERTTQGLVGYAGFLHGDEGQIESSEYRNQLSNIELVIDPRRKLTVYNGARNETLPPWLWWRWQLPPGIAAGTVQEANFLAQTRLKLDLREPPPAALTLLPGEFELRDRLPAALLHAFTDGAPVLLGHVGESYLGPYDLALAGDPTSTAHALRRLAAAYAANILSYRDEDSDVEPQDLVHLPRFDAVPDIVTTRFMGMEAQPFLVEAFVGHVYAANCTAVRTHPGFLNDPPIAVGDNVVTIEAPQSTIVAVQIANPFDKDVSLDGFRVVVFGQQLDLGLQDPATALAPGEARTYYSLVDGAAVNALKWLEVLHIDPPPNPYTLAVPPGVWSTSRGTYDDSSERDHAVEIWRRVGPTSFAVVDRLDIRPGQPNEPPHDSGGVNYQKFGEVVATDLGRITESCLDEPADGVPWFNASGIGTTDTHLAFYVRASRAWDDNILGIPDRERNPRYVFSFRDVNAVNGGQPFVGADAATTWFAEPLARFHDLVDPTPPNPSADIRKNVWDPKLAFPMQMLQKDGDFNQVGELLNVWLYGHELDLSVGGTPLTTLATFSEYMWDELEELDPEDRPRVNRLRFRPTDMILDDLGNLEAGPVLGLGDPNNKFDPLHAVPEVPAGMRVLELFVCDGYGFNPPGDLDGVGGPNTVNDYALARYGNAHWFSGRKTPGLINVNTATPEVMRSLPHWYRMVYEGVTETPRVRVPETVVRYRDRAASLGNQRPDYGDRDDFATDLRPERGIASIGELLLMTKTPTAFTATENRSWSIDFAADPGVVPGSALISTDVIDTSTGPDVTAGDVEESNLLFAGASNLITTRSDVFTVYFKVRSFTQNPVTGIWDATDPDHIVDDSRYVMLVDRSEVNLPTDRSRILYLEKLPK